MKMRMPRVTNPEYCDVCEENVAVTQNSDGSFRCLLHVRNRQAAACIRSWLREANKAEAHEFRFI